MADNVQWIRLKVGMFDGNSFKKIKRAKIGGVSYRDKLTAVWFELLDLAGKSNANGYLIDNNEIPYHSFEDIAVMLDREEKEIELCMGFFITEKMVEIVDDMYCLTNFMQYQNQEGLEKIREQKRLRQARWRERKALGLVDEKASTQPSTAGLPSISISISNSNIEDKDIIESNSLTTTNNQNKDDDDIDNMSCLKELQRLYPDIENDITSTAFVDEPNYAVIIDQFGKSEYLRTKCKSLSWIIKNHKKIESGFYADKPNPSQQRDSSLPNIEWVQDKTGAWKPKL